MIYMPILKSQAEPLSRAIFNLHRPEHIRQPGEATTHYCEWIEHPETDFAVLGLPEQEFLPLHLEADASQLVGILAPFVAAGSLTQEEVDEIVAEVSAGAGGMINVVDLIPASWQPYMMTREQAEAAGYFGQVEE